MNIRPKKEPEHTLIAFRASKSFRDLLRSKAQSRDLTVTAYIKQLIRKDLEAGNAAD